MQHGVAGRWTDATSTRVGCRKRESPVLGGDWPRFHSGSVVVIDLKGENHAVTAGRRSQLGRVLTLDPFRLRGEETAAFNPWP